MKCYVFKANRTNKKTGKSVSARTYTGCYRLAGDLKETRVALGVSDKSVADAKLKKLVRELEQERAGIILPKFIREGMKNPLAPLILDFISERENQGRDRKYCLGLRRQLELLAKNCGWKNLELVTADSFRRWRDKAYKLTDKTLNEYLTSANSFMNWLMREERLSRNPLISVQRMERRQESKYRRRALTDAEAKRLIATAGEWSHLYWLAVETGLRRGELEKLEWRDLAIDQDNPFLRARATTTKNGKADQLPLCPEIAACFLKLRPVPFVPGAKVFGKLPDMDRVRVDYKKANIQPVDAEVRIADFHGFRHTLGTRLALSNAPIPTAMKLLRHSDPKLTTKVYTDAGQLPTRETMLALPSLAPLPESYAPDCALKIVPACHSGSSEGMRTAGYMILQAVENQSFSLGQSLTVTSSHNSEDGARCRVRTCDPIRVKDVLYH